MLCMKQELEISMRCFFFFLNNLVLFVFLQEEEEEDSVEALKPSPDVDAAILFTKPGGDGRGAFSLSYSGNSMAWGHSLTSHGFSS